MNAEISFFEGYHTFLQHAMVQITHEKKTINTWFKEYSLTS